MNVKDAMIKIKKDEKLKKKFYENPKQVLEQLDVKTDNLKIKKIDTSKPGTIDKASICVSVGEVVGVSVGS